MNLEREQIYDNFLAATDGIIRQKPDVLVHAGDLFDTVRSEQGSLDRAGALERLHAAGIPLVIIPGNHRLHPV